jgi:phage shock protein PspC (stress-responsive transcriptional regulator)
MLFGVAGGMARFLDIDPSIVRIVWALLALAGGAGLLLYIVAAIVIPEAPLGWEGPTASTPGGPAPDVSGSGSSATQGAASSTPSSGTSGPAWGYRAGVERRERGGGAVLLGLILVVVGAWFLLQRFVPDIDADLLWPGVLLLLGAALIVGALRR